MAPQRKNIGRPDVAAAKAALELACFTPVDDVLAELSDGVTAVEMILGMNQAEDAYEMALELEDRAQALSDILSCVSQCFRLIKNNARDLARSEPDQVMQEIVESETMVELNV